MYSSRLSSTLLRLFGAFSFVCAVMSLYSVPAYAEAFELSGTMNPIFEYDDDGDWSDGVTTTDQLVSKSMAFTTGTDTGALDLWYENPAMSGTITVPGNTTVGATGGTWRWYNSGDSTLDAGGTYTIYLNEMTTTHDKVFTLTTSNFSNGTNYIGFRYYSSNNTNNQFFVKKGQKLRLIHPYKTIGIMDNNSGKNFTVKHRNLTLWSVWTKRTGGTSSVAVECETDKYGNYIVPEDSMSIIVTCNLSFNGGNYTLIDQPKLYLLDDVVADAIQDQTTDLMSTDGSGSVVNNMVIDYQGQLTQKLGFIAQTGTIISDLYDAITYEGVGTVTFPGVYWEGQAIIPQTNVPITGWLPDIEQNVKDFNTAVLFLMWLHGLHLLYVRITMGETAGLSEEMGS